VTNAEILNLRAQLSDIYRDYRNTCLSKKYYELRLRQTERVNFWYEVTLAVGTSGTVAGWAFWKFPIADVVWPVLGGIVSVLAIIKPILGLSSRIEKLTTLFANYSTLLIDFQLLIFEIKRKGKLDKADREVYFGLCEKFKTGAGKDEPAPSVKVLRELRMQVDCEIPVESLWSPK